MGLSADLWTLFGAPEGVGEGGTRVNIVDSGESVGVALVDTAVDLVSLEEGTDVEDGVSGLRVGVVYLGSSVAAVKRTCLAVVRLGHWDSGAAGAT